MPKTCKPSKNDVETLTYPHQECSSYIENRINFGYWWDNTHGEYGVMLANDERPGECYECIDGRQCPGHGMKCDTSWKNNKCVPKEPRDALRGPCDVRLMIFRRRGGFLI